MIIQIDRWLPWLLDFNLTGNCWLFYGYEYGQILAYSAKREQWAQSLLNQSRQLAVNDVVLCHETRALFGYTKRSRRSKDF